MLINRAIGYFDLYVSVGPAAVDSQRGVHVGGHLGVGFNVYFNRWLGLNSEIRDRITIEELVHSGDSLTNTVTASVGITVLLPFNFRYSYTEAD